MHRREMVGKMPKAHNDEVHLKKSKQSYPIRVMKKETTEEIVGASEPRGIREIIRRIDGSRIGVLNQLPS